MPIEYSEPEGCPKTCGLSTSQLADPVAALVRQCGESTERLEWRI